ncbi:MAG: CRISPR-associated protein, Cas5h family [uncultured Sulfurovum sp.]|uniref:CRISPR-associated protein, Cas5h family n=1 Tax=uncultured Sulfurovum sp. TaxID=269237 RepID=A0A6S6UBR0_9BACT|nr:MAG: CRISPR-associated protein, Cas5h family [uncultured Sulfurovum sp.]
MKAISFILSAKTAIFKKPDVNSYLYVTYNNIHKPALLGLLGAIIGLGGYNQLHTQKELLKEKVKGSKGKDKKVLQEELFKLEEQYPEFYEKLKDLKVSITPLAPHGYFSKKVQVFNNSVGYASKEAGGNLIVREQWLEKPKWKIMILDDGSEMYEKLKGYLLSKQSTFIPYLGKNDHPVKIDKVNEIVLSSELVLDQGNYVDSLFIKKREIDGYEKEGEMPFVFQEVSPMRLQEEFHFYEYETLCFTNCELEEMPNNTFSFNQKNYAFF